MKYKKIMGLILTCLLSLCYFVSNSSAQSPEEVTFFATNPENYQSSQVSPFIRGKLCEKKRKYVEQQKGKNEKTFKRRLRSFERQCMKQSVRSVRNGFESLLSKIDAELKGKYQVSFYRYPYPEEISFLGEDSKRKDQGLEEIREEINGAIIKLRSLSEEEKQKRLAKVKEEKNRKTSEEDCDPDDVESLCEEEEGDGNWELVYNNEIREVFRLMYREGLTKEGVLKKSLLSKTEKESVSKKLDVIFTHFYNIKEITPARKRIYMRMYLYDTQESTEGGVFPLYDKITVSRPWNQTSQGYVAIMGAELSQVLEQFGK